MKRLFDREKLLKALFYRGYALLVDFAIAIPVSYFFTQNIILILLTINCFKILTYYLWEISWVRTALRKLKKHEETG